LQVWVQCTTNVHVGCICGYTRFQMQ
jgi:hypothetical protein